MGSRKAGHLQSGLRAQEDIQWKDSGCGSAWGVYGEMEAFLWLDCEVYEGKGGQKVEKRCSGWVVGSGALIEGSSTDSVTRAALSRGCLSRGAP